MYCNVKVLIWNWMGDDESDQDGLVRNWSQKETLIHMMVSQWIILGQKETEKTWMDLNVEILLSKMIVYDKSNQDGLEKNWLQHDNMLWNVIGFNESYRYRKEPHESQRKVFANKKRYLLLQQKLSKILIKSWKHWKSSTACMTYMLKEWQID